MRHGWRKWLRTVLGERGRVSHPSRRPCVRPMLEVLEGRTLPAASTWVPEGPAPELHGTSTVPQNDAVSGALESIAVNPNNTSQIIVGTVNGLILPISLGVMLVASRRPKIVGSYRHPLWLLAAGAVVAASMAVMGGWSIWKTIPLIFK